MNSDDYTKEQIERLGEGISELGLFFIVKIVQHADKLGIDRDYALDMATKTLFGAVQSGAFRNLDLSKLIEEADEV